MFSRSRATDGGREPSGRQDRSDQRLIGDMARVDLLAKTAQKPVEQRLQSTDRVDEDYSWFHDVRSCRGNMTSW